MKPLNALLGKVTICLILAAGCLPKGYYYKDMMVPPLSEALVMCTHMIFVFTLALG